MRLAKAQSLPAIGGRSAVFQGFRKGRRRVVLAAAALCALTATAYAQQKAEAFDDQAQILKRFSGETGVVKHGVKVRLKTGGWLDATDNPFSDAAPTLCWYVPKLHVAGICQSGKGLTVTTLVELNTGKRKSAPGLPMLMPQDGLVAIGPDKGHGADADSVTLIKVNEDGLVDEGGAIFDDDYGPGGWVDGDCYRLTAKGAKGGAWLERGASGWDQVTTADSKVCQGRHGR
jgi:hypothetical protein